MIDWKSGTAVPSTKRLDRNTEIHKTQMKKETNERNLLSRKWDVNLEEKLYMRVMKRSLKDTARIFAGPELFDAKTQHLPFFNTKVGLQRYVTQETAREGRGLVNALILDS